jgi:hypothetical protein
MGWFNLSTDELSVTFSLFCPSLTFAGKGITIQGVSYKRKKVLLDMPQRKNEKSHFLGQERLTGRKL